MTGNIEAEADAEAEAEEDTEADSQCRGKIAVAIPALMEYNITKGGSAVGLTVYVCLDDRDGMSFNGRRQSRDSRVFEDIRRELQGPLLIDPFSESLCRRAEIPYQVLEGPLPKEGQFFLEAREPREALEADRIVIYRWGRHYPADVRWTLDLGAAGFVPLEQSEFPGSSHESIRREVYVR